MNDQAIGKMFTDLENAEAKLMRAFNRWAKLKAKVRRFDKRYAKELAAAMPVHDLPRGAKPWPQDMEHKGGNKRKR
jgi:hypothetical protein